MFSVFLGCYQALSIFVFRLCLHSATLHTATLHFQARTNFAVLQKPCQGNSRKLQRSGYSRFGGSEKDR